MALSVRLRAGIYGSLGLNGNRCSTVQKVTPRAPLSRAVKGKRTFSWQFTASSLLGTRKAFILEFTFKRNSMSLLNVSPPSHLDSHRHDFHVERCATGPKCLEKEEQLVIGEKRLK